MAMDSTKAQTAHWQRVLRGVMYGFAAHEQAGGFSHEAVDENESYRIAIQCVVDGLHRAGEEAAWIGTRTARYSRKRP